MPKIFDKELEDKRIIRMNEDRFFKLFQRQLLWLANTQEGRDFLCIDKSFPVVHEIAKNYIRHHDFVTVPKSKENPDGLQRVTTSEFRVGAKYANIIRYRWEAWLEYLVDYEVSLFLRTMQKQYVPEYAFVGGRQMSVMHTTTTVYPDPDPETTTVDGPVYQEYSAASGQSWATIRGAAGSGASDNGVTMSISISGDSVLNQWVLLRRGIALFDTSSLGDTDTISAAVLSFKSYGKSDPLGSTPDATIVSSAPASDTALAAGDYDSLGTTEFASRITYASWSGSGYNDFTLNASGISAISKTGVSKFGLINGNHDLDNSSPTWAWNSSDLDIYSVDHSGTTNGPKLVVTHAGAATGGVLSNLLMMGVG